MHVTRLRLTTFRNHVATDVRFAPGVNVLIGPNGQGKTNVVEAISVLATGSSHRTHQLLALIQAKRETAVINADVAHDARFISVDIALDRTGANKARANGNPVRMRELTRFVHAVTFAPEDLSIVRDNPEERRAFVDSIVTVLAPRMISVLSDYDRVVKQRNSLLKSLRAVPRANRDLTTLSIWDEKIISLGTEITHARLAAISLLRAPLTTAYASIAGSSHHVDVTLSSRVDDSLREDSSRDAIADKFATSMIAALEDDLERGTTSVGPHRDDLVFVLNDLPVKGYASHGETWSFVLSLRLATAELYRHESLGDPILILDDVFAELDVSRRDRLTAAIRDFEQVIITAAVQEDVPDVVVAKKFLVDDGVVTEVVE